MKKILAIAIVLLTISCTDADKSTGIEGTHDVSSDAFTIVVHVFDTKNEMWKRLKEEGLDRRKVEGKAAWTISRDMSQLYGCDIYVTKPKTVNDSNTMETWGHELAHCVYGTYHPE
jgi:hypothetical protein